MFIMAIPNIEEQTQMLTLEVAYRFGLINLPTEGPLSFLV